MSMVWIARQSEVKAIIATAAHAHACKSIMMTSSQSTQICEEQQSWIFLDHHESRSPRPHNESQDLGIGRNEKR